MSDNKLHDIKKNGYVCKAPNELNSK